MRLVVTGSKGLLGGYVFDYAARQGADVLGVDIVGRGLDYDRYLAADLTDLGQAYDVLHGADAVIHLAAINDQKVFTGVRTFMANVGSTYNVLYAASRLGVRRVVLASSIQVNHTSRPRTPIRYRYLPVDEDHPVDPQDEYGLSKVVGETAADMFARCYGLTAVSLRFVWVASLKTCKNTRRSARSGPATRRCTPTWTRATPPAPVIWPRPPACRRIRTPRCSSPRAIRAQTPLRSKSPGATIPTPRSGRGWRVSARWSAGSGRSEMIGFVAEKSWRYS